jgi:anti-anti-sigma factor
VERIFHTGPALGLTSDAQFAEVEIELTPGDQLLMYTDGLLEAQGVPSTTPDEIARALGENDGEPEHLLQQLLRRAEGGQKDSHTDDVTMVLLGGADSHSSLDNGRSNEAAPRGVAPPTNGVVLVGETNETMFFCLEGSLNWMQANAFHERCLRELDNGRDVVLDLSVCTYMDSTFLGTIQEAAEYADRATGSLHIQGLLPEIRALLEELGLASVLAHADAAMHVLPADLTPVTAEPAGPDDQVRVLRAHEVLASLNESNRKQFGRLVEHLRKELETADSQDE